MTAAIILALTASFFTAASSVAQRLAAAPAPDDTAFSWRLLSFVLRRPVWFLGIALMIGGFLFQLAALQEGDLSLVQPLIATEVLFVFGFLAVRWRSHVRVLDWVAAAGMAVGLGTFLFLAHPSGDSVAQAKPETWAVAAIATFGAAAIVAAIAIFPLGDKEPSPARKAALMAISAGISFGFVAAVIKVLATQVSHGPAAVFTNWSPYVLLLTGAVSMFLATNAYQAGPLAASQPGLTIADPLVAILLGVTVFGEHLESGPRHLTGEAIAAAVLVGSVVLLSRSPLIQTQHSSAEGGVDLAGAGPHLDAPGGPPAPRPQAPVSDGQRGVEPSPPADGAARPGEAIREGGPLPPHSR
jgi:drug/metabolite transporter (DMT)-like permease